MFAVLVCLCCLSFHVSLARISTGVCLGEGSEGGRECLKTDDFIFSVHSHPSTFTPTSHSFARVLSFINPIA